MACCSYILLTFIKFLAFILPSWASEKQPIKVMFRQKNSSPIQKQESRKNYPWVSLEGFNRFSSNRWKAEWEMPAHRAGSPLGPSHQGDNIPLQGSPPQPSIQGISGQAPLSWAWQDVPRKIFGLSIC